MMNGDLRLIPADILLEDVPSVLLLFSPSGDLVASSAVARSSLGLNGESDESCELFDLLVPSVRAVFANDAPMRIEQVSVRVGGASRLFGFSGAPVRIGGRASAVLVTGKDITERENLNREIQALERAAHVETIVSRVSHELRNPLNAVRGYAQFASLQLGSSDPARESLSVIVKEIDRMDRLLIGLRDLGAASHLELTVADPEVCLRDALRTTAPLFAEKGMMPRVEIDGPLPDVLHDPGRFHQVFLNLLKNAAEAIQVGGSVLVRAGAIGPSGFWAEVQDDGPGVDQSLGERVFDLFVSTKGSRGEGIGLAVCREIVSGHGGRLGYSSAPGGGAVFRVEVDGP